MQRSFQTSSRENKTFIYLSGNIVETAISQQLDVKIHFLSDMILNILSNLKIYVSSDYDFKAIS